jgi:3,4-dihydroxy 2-butanone 4-phosphate synthase/GTP cyclohydrolase II
MTRLDTVERAVADIAAGRAVVVIDDEDRENEGDLIFAAEKATPELVAFMVRYTSGYLCVPLEGAICDRLGLLPMYAVNQDKHGTAYTVTVDARVGVGTGISASDRATTMRLLADPSSGIDDFTKPGHVVPLRAKDGGVLRRPGHTEAAVDLARMAGLQPAGAICEIVSQKDEGAMAQTDELRIFADEHGLALISIADLIEYRRKHEKHVERVADDVHARPGRQVDPGVRLAVDQRPDAAVDVAGADLDDVAEPLAREHPHGVRVSLDVH